VLTNEGKELLCVAVLKPYMYRRVLRTREFQRKREIRGDSGEAANENDFPVILDKYP
jgi:hypothetical protein